MNKLLISAFVEIDTPFSAAGCYGYRTSGRGLGVAKIAVKFKDIVPTVEFLSRGFDLGTNF